ncbi:MAG: hypothetical protein II951_05880 [Bacteroidales bacterium]|nr:hypothetical protein [Bacteroidales bacterium]
MLAASAFAVVAGVNVYNAQVTETAMSDLQMENIEALAAEPEVTVGGPCATNVAGLCLWTNPYELWFVYMDYSR